MSQSGSVMHKLIENLLNSEPVWDLLAFFIVERLKESREAVVEDLLLEGLKESEERELQYDLEAFNRMIEFYGGKVE